MVQFPFSKRKTSWLKLNGNVSFQDYVDMLGDDDCDASHQKKIRREVNQNLNAEGPCGKILRSMRIPMENDDEDYEWHFFLDLRSYSKCLLNVGLGVSCRWTSNHSKSRETTLTAQS